MEWKIILTLAAIFEKLRIWFRHIAHTPLAEFNMYIPPEMGNIVIIWRFSVYIFRQINSFLYLCGEIAIKEV